MTTTTRPERKTPPWRQATQEQEQTLRHRVQEKRESFPGLNDARLAVANLRSEEQSLVGKLQAPLNPEDPHFHEGIRQKLAAVRQKIGPAQVSERTAELDASKSALDLFLPEHTEASAAFVDSLESVLAAYERMMELRTVATSFKLPLSRETAFYGLDQMQALRQQLIQILKQWQG